MEIDKLNNWCKWLEKNFSNDLMIPTLPIVVRFDGNNFSKWTKDLSKPFSNKFTDIMHHCTKELIKSTGAKIGYTQSDEITLIFYSDDRRNVFYAGKKQKILSKTTSLLTTLFNDKCKELLPNKKNAYFDCRIYQTPTLQDALAQIIWRRNDAMRNSILMLGASKFSHSELLNKNTSEISNMLLQSYNINWHSLDIKFKEGVIFMNKEVNKAFTKDELENLPEFHQARKNQELTYTRNELVQVSLEDNDLNNFFKNN